MNFNYINDNKFIIRVNTSYLVIDNNDLNKIIKSILIKVKKRYLIDIIGFYDVDIFYFDNLLTIMIFNKKDKDNYFSNIIDLKINKHKKKIKINNENIFDNSQNNIYMKCEFNLLNSLNL